MSESASFQNTHTTFVTPTQNNTFSRGYWIENWILSLGTLLLFDCAESLWILYSSILSQCGFHLNIAFVCSCFFHQMLLWVSLYQYYQDRRTPADTAEADSVSQLRSLSLYKHKHLTARRSVIPIICLISIWCSTDAPVSPSSDTYSWVWKPPSDQLFIAPPVAASVSNVLI